MGGAVGGGDCVGLVVASGIGMSMGARGVRKCC